MPGPSNRQRRLACLVLCLIAGVTVGRGAAAAPLAEVSQRSGEAPAGTVVGVPPPIADDLSAADRSAIQRQLRDALSALAARGQAQPRIAGAPVTLGWPLEAAPSVEGWDFHGISNFVDEDAAYPGHVLDYQCGGRSYDLASGYNHAGVDIFLWPFAWNRVDANAVAVVAAADGVIVDKRDGNYDRNCSLSGGQWNAVYVRHADGSIAWYGHLKRDSLTNRPVGARVARGDYLGIVGSSGNSTGPHLHLELYDADGNLTDPFAGPCNFLGGVSWWEQQRPYFDSGVNEMTTGTAAPDFGTCPEPTTSHRQDVVVRGRPVYFTTYFRDLRPEQRATHTIFTPDGTPFSQWVVQTDGSYYPAYYSYSWYDTFAPKGALGEWRFRAELDGVAYEIPFTVVARQRDVPTSTPTVLATATPLPVRCAGDCNADGRVDIAEIILAVRIALGDANLGECSAADREGDGRVGIAELVESVNGALAGCAAP